MNTLHFFTSHITFIFACLIILGTFFNIFFKALEVLAAFTFAGFFYAESMFEGYKFKLAKEGKKRIVIVTLGAINTIFLYGLIRLVIVTAMNNTISPPIFVSKLTQFIPFGYSLMSCLLILSIFLISKFTKDEDAGKVWYDKLFKLNLKNPF